LHTWVGDAKKKQAAGFWINLGMIARIRTAPSECPIRMYSFVLTRFVMKYSSL